MLKADDLFLSNPYSRELVDQSPSIIVLNKPLISI